MSLADCLLGTGWRDCTTTSRVSDVLPFFFYLLAFVLILIVLRHFIYRWLDKGGCEMTDNLDFGLSFFDLIQILLPSGLALLVGFALGRASSRLGRGDGG